MPIWDRRINKPLSLSLPFETRQASEYNLYPAKLIGEILVGERVSFNYATNGQGPRSNDTTVSTHSLTEVEIVTHHP